MGTHVRIKDLKKNKKIKKCINARKKKERKSEVKYFNKQSYLMLPFMTAGCGKLNSGTSF